MKKIASKGYVKAIAFIFALLTGSIMILSGIITALLANDGAYNNTRTYYIQHRLSTEDYDNLYDLYKLTSLISNYFEQNMDDQTLEQNIQKLVNQNTTNSQYYSIEIQNERTNRTIFYSSFQNKKEDQFYNIRDTFPYSLSDNQIETTQSEVPADENATVSESERSYLCTITTYISSDIPSSSGLYTTYHTASTMYDNRYIPVVILVCAAIIFFLLLIFLTYASGRRSGQDEIIAHGTAKIPLEIWFILLGIAFIFGLLPVQYARDTIDFVHYKMNPLYLLPAFAIILGFTCIGLVFWMDFTNRLKAKKFWRNSLTYRICHMLFYLFRNLHLIWKAALVIAGISFLEFFIILIAANANSFGFLMFVWFVEKLIMVPAIFFLLLQLRKLQKGAHTLAEGDLHHQVDTKGMYLDIKNSANDLNSIQIGIRHAVDESMKSERMKTELITNVSHDIKTPLTSIVNYVDLLSREALSPEIAKEYVEILQKHSGRLKHLIESLVEASKASSGAMEVNLIPCDVNILLGQLIGEYEEKLQAKHLSIVTKFPEQPSMIMGDGKLLFRVFDNLLGNICKYSMEGSRVYVSIQTDKVTTIEFKNISANELNVEADELMERFVRGDASRNSEGSGLGLSIARSLAELQNGKLKLQVDGDLFKATVIFQSV